MYDLPWENKNNQNTAYKAVLYETNNIKYLVFKFIKYLVFKYIKYIVFSCARHCSRCIINNPVIVIYATTL